MSQDKVYDVIVIGGGQSALAVAYYLTINRLLLVILYRYRLYARLSQGIYIMLCLLLIISMSRVLAGMRVAGKLLMRLSSVPVFFLLYSIWHHCMFFSLMERSPHTKQK